MIVKDGVLQGIALQSAVGLFRRLLTTFTSHTEAAAESFGVLAQLIGCVEAFEQTE
jgi:hypothetical protein